MEIVITGHTRGIGLALANKFQTLGCNITGYSISQGCDIGNPEHREQLIKDAHNVDLFINNAFHPTGQADLLKEFNIRYPNKAIINISSKGALVDINLVKNPQLQMYNTIKQNLNSVANRLMLNGTRILNVLPGVVDTDMGMMFPGPKLDPMYLADIIVEQFNNSHIQQLIIDVPGTNWNVYYQL
jgi:NAD(P)-dependent dehydrogenase (short-subunit alcohol dehydrogenase family)